MASHAVAMHIVSAVGEITADRVDPSPEEYRSKAKRSRKRYQLRAFWRGFGCAAGAPGLSPPKDDDVCSREASEDEFRDMVQRVRDNFPAANDLYSPRSGDRFAIQRNMDSLNVTEDYPRFICDVADGHTNELLVRSRCTMDEFQHYIDKLRRRIVPYCLEYSRLPIFHGTLCAAESIVYVVEGRNTGHSPPLVRISDVLALLHHRGDGCTAKQIQKELLDERGTNVEMPVPRDILSRLERKGHVDLHKQRYFLTPDGGT